MTAQLLASVPLSILLGGDPKPRVGRLFAPASKANAVIQKVQKDSDFPDHSLPRLKPIFNKRQMRTETSQHQGADDLRAGGWIESEFQKPPPQTTILYRTAQYQAIGHMSRDGTWFFNGHMSQAEPQPILFWKGVNE